MDPHAVEALVKAIELKDLSTAAHTWRVVLYTRALAESMHMNHEFIERVTLAAALHDVGKLDIPDEVLQKPGPLNDAEFDLMKTHTLRGHERLLSLGEGDPIMLELVRHHHERIDGRGYPDGLTADRIPAPARFFSVIDSFDAMTSIRPYRTQVGPEAARHALEELRTGIGSRYCAECVEAFVRLYASGELDYILAYFNDSCPVPPIARIADSRSIARTGRVSG